MYRNGYVYENYTEKKNKQQISSLRTNKTIHLSFFHTVMTCMPTRERDEGLALQSSRQEAIHDRICVVLLKAGEQRHQLGQRGPRTHVLHTQHLRRKQSKRSGRTAGHTRTCYTRTNV